MSDTNIDVKLLKRGRTKEQKKVIDYFCGSGGCLFGGMSDQAYDEAVSAKAKSINFKQKALDKIGVDESQVNEIEPVHFEGYDFGKNTLTKRGKDGLWRSSAYQISWIFFSDNQVYVYQYTFNMDEDGKKETTEEYFYKDVTNFSTTSDTIEKEVAKKNCGGGVTYERTNVDHNRFALVVPGDKFYCSMKQNDYTERAIQGMKAKLREKKN